VWELSCRKPPRHQQLQLSRKSWPTRRVSLLHLYLPSRRPVWPSLWAPLQLHPAHQSGLDIHLLKRNLSCRTWQMLSLTQYDMTCCADELTNDCLLLKFPAVLRNSISCDIIGVRVPVESLVSEIYIASCWLVSPWYFWYSCCNSFDPVMT